MGVSGTSTPGNNSISVSGTGTLLNNAIAVDASGNYWGSNVFATITAGISTPATVDYSPYLNNGTNLAGIGFQGDFSNVTAHAGGSQLRDGCHHRSLQHVDGSRHDPRSDRDLYRERESGCGN